MDKLQPNQLLALLLLQLGLLVLLFVSWHADWWNLDSLAPGGVLGGGFPVIVPWAGAVGGATNAIRGLVANWPKYAEDQPGSKCAAHRLRWNTWAFVQPVLGAVFGSIAVLIVTLLLGILGSSNTLDVSASGQMLLTAVAFIVGYRQKTFHDLVTRSVNVLFGPGDAVLDNDEGGAGTSSIVVEPVKLDLEAAPQTPTTGKVTLKNMSTSMIPKDQVVLSLINLTPAGTTAFNVDPLRANLGSRNKAEVTVRFDPGQAPGPFTATLRLAHGELVRTVALTGTVKSAQVL